PCGSGFRDQSGFGPNSRPAEIFIELRRAVRLRDARLGHCGATEELGPAEVGLRPSLDEHGRAKRTRGKNLSSHPRARFPCERGGRREKSRGLGGGHLAPRRSEIGSQASRVSGFEDTTFEQDDRGAIALA